jgi:hypothetical protein
MKVHNPPDEMIDEFHKKYMSALQQLHIRQRCKFDRDHRGHLRNVNLTFR